MIDLALPYPSEDSPAFKRSQLLSDCIRQHIIRDGNISFADFMEQALYHPQFGYYESPSFALGKNGDFTTATHISPLYAHCFARQLSSLFKLLNKGNLLELGAGTGQFAHDLIHELSRANQEWDHYYIYEISNHLRQKQQTFLKETCPAFFSRITWLSSLPQNFSGIILANEVLDALPVHCFRIEEQQIKEKRIGWEAGFVWQLCEAQGELKENVASLQKRYSLSHDYESEIHLHLATFVTTLTKMLTEGIIFFADYGYGEQEYYHHDRHRGSLTCFYQHRHHSQPLILPGLQDITAHVNFTQVAEIATHHQCSLAGYTSQAAFLLACGLLDLAKEQEDKLNSLDAFHLHQQIKLLTLPQEMGEYVKIMALSKNIAETAMPLLGFSLQDRKHHL